MIMMLGQHIFLHQAYVLSCRGFFVKMQIALDNTVFVWLKEI